MFGYLGLIFCFKFLFNPLRFISHQRKWQNSWACFAKLQFLNSCTKNPIWQFGVLVNSIIQKLKFGTIHLRRKKILKNFDPYPFCRHFVTSICWQICPIFNPFPPKEWLACCRKAGLLKSTVPFLKHARTDQPVNRNLENANVLNGWFLLQNCTAFFSVSFSGKRWIWEDWVAT